MKDRKDSERVILSISFLAVLLTGSAFLFNYFSKNVNELTGSTILLIYFFLMYSWVSSLILFLYIVLTIPIYRYDESRISNRYIRIIEFIRKGLFDSIAILSALLVPSIIVFMFAFIVLSFLSDTFPQWILTIFTAVLIVFFSIVLAIIIKIASKKSSNKN